MIYGEISKDMVKVTAETETLDIDGISLLKKF